MILIGLFLGRWQSILTVLAVASFTGSIIGLMLIISRSKQPHSQIPFAPFLVTAATLDFIWHDQVWTAYLKLIGWQ
jgi:prepilin signal peptidase PulO-like enzyme (type II secretory pathway)